jgi:hypothetical protein
VRALRPMNASYFSVLNRGELDASTDTTGRRSSCRTLATNVLLEAQSEIVGSATDGTELVSKVPRLWPDIIVIDMPILSGIDATHSTTRGRPVSQDSIPDGPLRTAVYRSTRSRGCFGICPPLPHEGLPDSSSTSGTCRSFRNSFCGADTIELPIRRHRHQRKQGLRYRATVGRS